MSYCPYHDYSNNDKKESEMLIYTICNKSLVDCCWELLPVNDILFPNVGMLGQQYSRFTMILQYVSPESMCASTMTTLNLNKKRTFRFLLQNTIEDKEKLATVNIINKTKHR